MAAFTKQDADDIEELMGAVNSIPAELDEPDCTRLGVRKPAATMALATDSILDLIPPFAGLKLVENPRMMPGAYQFEDRYGRALASGHVEFGFVAYANTAETTKVVCASDVLAGIKRAISAETGREVTAERSAASGETIDG